MGRLLPLYGRISLLITAIAIISVLGFAALALWSVDRYHQEVTQKLHRGLAQYVLENQPEPLLNSAGDVNESGLKAIAKNTMMINPAVEVYLLDSAGQILGHALPESSVAPTKINLVPVLRLINQRGKGPVLGDNPRNPQIPAIFSAAPLQQGTQTLGYLYIILASYQANSLAEQLADSHIIRLSTGALAAIAIFFGLSACFSFQVITRPLQRLIKSMRAYRTTSFAEDSNQEEPFKDEVEELEHSFQLMQRRIQQQFDQLIESDRLRRELMSNVSHDLRTPLASMQGYLETLLLKFTSLNSEQQKHYLHIAHRHSQQLALLTGQLFELSKLDAGRIEPQPEVFSLTELLFDIRQDYELTAGKKNISLQIHSVQANVLVVADIGLIQRALQNLMDNALRYTPRGGRIVIRVTTEQGQVRVDFEDSGTGIAAEDLPFVFDRFYQVRPDKVRPDKVRPDEIQPDGFRPDGFRPDGFRPDKVQPAEVRPDQARPDQAKSCRTTSTQPGAGLGLSIVKRILALHGSAIEVASTPKSGTSFSFLLPTPV